MLLKVLLASTAWFLFTGQLTAATIKYEVTDLPDVVAGQDLQRYEYQLSNIVLLQNQSFDIRFDPTRYGALSNGIASPGFDLVILQPNNPPGAFGDYDAMALTDNPPVGGPFRVDFVWLGPGQPGSQPFLINQFDANGNFEAVIAQGVTVPAAQVIPEPGTWLLTIAGFAATVVSRRKLSH